MADIVFEFGIGDSFFFDSPKAWEWKNLPSEFDPNFRDSRGSLQARNVYWTALGADGQYASAFRRKDGSNWFVWSGGSMKQIFGNLSLRNPENYRVALGPGSSYFVMTPDKYYWNNIHDDLKGFINDGDQSRIAEVSLGQNNYFFARKENGAWKYLVKRDSELHKLLQARANDIARVSLSPDSDHYFVVFKTGSCRFWVPKSWESKIWEVVRKAGISLDHSSTSGYSSGTNTNYRSNAVIGRQDPKKTFGSLQEVSSLISIGASVAGIISSLSCTVM